MTCLFIPNFDLIESEATYKIVVVKTSNLNGSIKDLFEHESIEDFIEEYNGLIYNHDVLKISLESEIDEQYTVCLVGVIEGYYYFSKEVTYSIKDVVNYYLNNNILTDQLMIDVLSTIK